MTKKERAQVVELLRCAADLFETRRNRRWPTREVATGVNSPGTCDDPVWRAAWDALYAVPSDACPDGEFSTKLLEAAARVEEGSYP